MSLEGAVFAATLPPNELLSGLNDPCTKHTRHRVNNSDSNWFAGRVTNKATANIHPRNLHLLNGVAHSYWPLMNTVIKIQIIPSND